MTKTKTKPKTKPARKTAKKVPAKRSPKPFTEDELARIRSAVRYAWEDIHSDFMQMINDPDHDSGRFTVRDVVETAMETLQFVRKLGPLEDKVAINFPWTVRYLIRNKSLWY
jgi:hypothetical protein